MNLFSTERLASVSGDTILHVAARAGHEAAAMFLANHGANGSSINKKVENPDNKKSSMH